MPFARPRLEKVISGALLAVAMASRAGPAHADPAATTEARDQAAALFAEGTRAYDAGKFKLAAEKFDAAYARAPHHAPLLNSARSWQRAGDAPRAATLFAKYLREAPPDARDRKAADAALVALAAKLARLEIAAPGVDELRIDGAPAAPPTVFVAPGVHAIEGRSGDRSTRQSANGAAGSTVSVSVSFADAPAPASGPTEPARPAAAPAPPATAPPMVAVDRDPPPPTRDDPLARRADRHGWSPTVAWVGVAVTGGLVLAGVASEIDYATYQKDHPGATGETLNEETKRLHRSSFLFGSAVVVGLATGAAALWLVDWHHGDAAAKVGVGPGSLLVRGGF